MIFQISSTHDTRVSILVLSKINVLWVLVFSDEMFVEIGYWVGVSVIWGLPTKHYYINLHGVLERGFIVFFE